MQCVNGHEALPGMASCAACGVPIARDGAVGGGVAGGGGVAPASLAGPGRTGPPPAGRSPVVWLAAVVVASLAVVGIAAVAVTGSSGGDSGGSSGPAPVASGDDRPAGTVEPDGGGTSVVSTTTTVAPLPPSVGELLNAEYRLVNCGDASTSVQMVNGYHPGSVVDSVVSSSAVVGTPDLPVHIGFPEFDGSEPHIAYGDLTGDGNAEAVVVLRSMCSASSFLEMLFVFTGEGELASIPLGGILGERSSNGSQWWRPTFGRPVVTGGAIEVRPIDLMNPSVVNQGLTRVGFGADGSLRRLG